MSIAKRAKKSTRKAKSTGSEAPAKATTASSATRERRPKPAAGGRANRPTPADPSRGQESVPAGHLVRTRGELARIFGVTVQGISRNLENGAPKKTAGGYDVAAWRSWRESRSGTQEASGTEWRQRAAKAQALLREHELEVKLGHYVSRADAEAGRLELLRWFAAVLERAGSDLAVRVAGKSPREVKSIVQGYFDDLRAQAAAK